MTTKGVTIGAGAKDRSSEAESARRALHVAIGKRIRAVRKNLGIGQAECAQNAFIDTSSMFRIEKGQQNLTVETLARVALALAVPIEDLLIGVVPDPTILEARTRD